jgi:hypothetical protein
LRAASIPALLAIPAPAAAEAAAHCHAGHPVATVVACDVGGIMGDKGPGSKGGGKKPKGGAKPGDKKKK